MRVLKRKRNGTDILFVRPIRMKHKYEWEIVKPLKNIFSLQDIIGKIICISNGNEKIDGEVVKVTLLNKSPDLGPVHNPPPPIKGTSGNNSNIDVEQSRS